MVEVIMECITKVSFQLVWNVECTEVVHQTRGIRQGDPISLYVIVLCLERLTHHIQKEVDEGHWRPIRALNGPAISHSFFADDLILFADSSCNNPSLLNKKIWSFFYL